MQRIGAAIDPDRQGGESDQDQRFGIAETSAEIFGPLAERRHLLLLVGADQEVGKSEDHLQRQPRLAVAKRLQPLAHQRHARDVGAEVPAEADVAAGETEGGTRQRAGVARLPCRLHRSPKGPPRPGQVGAEQLLLAELEQRRRTSGEVRRRQQREDALLMRCRLLVIVRLGGTGGGGAICGKRRLGSGEPNREAVVASQIGRLRAGIGLQGPCDREMQTGTAGVARASDQRLAHEGMGKGDGRRRRDDIVDQPLGKCLPRGVLRGDRLQPGCLGRQAERRRGADRGERAEQPLGIGPQPPEALLDEVGYCLWHRGRLQRLTLAQRSPPFEIARQLTGEEGVAGGACL
jgi:hypothetical protein